MPRNDRRIQTPVGVRESACKQKPERLNINPMGNTTKGPYRRKQAVRTDEETQKRRNEHAASIIGIRDAADQFFANRGKPKPSVSEIIQGRPATQEGGKRWVSRLKR